MSGEIKSKAGKVVPGLYLVPVPIGNLEDISLRALKVLRAAQIIACEDTRSTGQLLKLYGISAPALRSYHEHNEGQREAELIAAAGAGNVVALVSDAGSPLISDPGHRLVSLAAEQGISIVPLPGPTAFVPALMAAGLPTHEFLFVGFPPHNKGRKAFIERLAASDTTVVLYESPHRLERLLAELLDCGMGARRIALCRELSKKHEEIIRATVAECLARLQSKAARGEYVVVIGPHSGA